MNLLEFIGIKPKTIKEVPTDHVPVISPNANYEHVFTISQTFDGEKNIGEIGPIKRYSLDYAALSARGWQMYLDSEICQLVINRFALWVVGKGLKLQAQPSQVVLGMNKLKLPADFVEQVEARWHLFETDKMVDIKEQSNLGQLAKFAFVNAKNGGDVLVILRVIDGFLQIQLVDVENVVTPNVGIAFLGTDTINKDTNNKIINGVEVDAYGKHIAYHICVGCGKWERVVARSNEGRRVAYLVGGLKYRLSSTRSMPLINAVMETASKLERYKEATVGSAEEAAKLAITVEHESYSTGENPIIGSVVKASGHGRGAGSGDNPVDSYDKKLADTVAATTNKQLINLPLGAKLQTLESKKELHFSEFYMSNIYVVCAVVGIPPEVALQKYDSNFSASRAALKDWEHTLQAEREQFKIEFYTPIYEFWLDIQILKNKIIAPGYLTALLNNDREVLAAYRKCNFLGANVPHIDPLKEVNAERAKLGKGSEHLPLTTLEQATTALGGGDYWENMVNYSKEMNEAESLGINTVQLQEQTLPVDTAN